MKHTSKVIKALIFDALDKDGIKVSAKAIDEAEALVLDHLAQKFQAHFENPEVRELWNKLIDRNEQ